MKLDKKIIAGSHRTEFQQESTLRTLFNDFIDPVLLMDLDGVILECNQAFASVFGISVPDLLQTNAYDLLPQGYKEERERTVEKAITTAKRIIFEVERFGRNYRHSIYPISDKEGSVYRLYVIAQDITEQKVAEKSLTQHEFRLRQFFESHSAVMLILDSNNGQIIAANNAAVAFYGWPRDILLTMCLQDIINVTSEEANSDIENIMGSKQKQAQFRHNRADGSFRDVEVFSAPVKIGDKELLYAIIHDITDRKTIEHELISSRIRLTQALEAAHSGVWEWDLKTNKYIGSDELWALYGLERKNKIPSFKLWVDAIHHDDREMVIQAVTAITGRGAKLNIEYRVCHPDGSVRWLMSRGMPLRDDKGRVERYIGTIIDITDRKLLEEEKETLQTQLQHKQKLHLVGQLAGGIAHDFNNMLTVILGHAEIALDRKDSSYDDIIAIQRAATHSAELTRQLLAFSRKQHVSPKVIDLNASIENMLSMLKRLVAENITLTWLPRKNDAFVIIDPLQINQILANLCINASDAIQSNGKISIETGKIHVDEVESASGHVCSIPGAYITLSITDNGNGIDKKNLPHIFEPFYTTKEVGKGVGMGLATVYGIVKQCNGYITVKSRIGEGTAISIYLPQQQADIVRVEGVGKYEKPVLIQGKEVILLVEDQADILSLCKEILQNQGYRVLDANGPTQAIELVRQHQGEIDLLLTDVVMPEMNGRELFEKIHPVCRNMKVLYMSGYAADFIAHHLEGDTSANVIEKPFPISALIKAVQNILQEKPDTAITKKRSLPYEFDI